VTRTSGRLGAEARRATVTTWPVTPIMTKSLPSRTHVPEFNGTLAAAPSEDNAADPWEQWEAVHP